MAYITDYQYYENGGVNPTNSNWGSYQFVSLDDIVTNFMLMYVGNDIQIFLSGIPIDLRMISYIAQEYPIYFL